MGAILSDSFRWPAFLLCEPPWTHDVFSNHSAGPAQPTTKNPGGRRRILGSGAGSVKVGAGSQEAPLV